MDAVGTENRCDIAKPKTAAKDHIPKKIINVVFARNIYELEIDLSAAFTCSSAVISDLSPDYDPVFNRVSAS